uniref:N-acetylglucosamine kinase n=1 Tax=Nonomuraea bangladeshensis TaxID=404385 RepID=UPI003F49888D
MSLVLGVDAGGSFSRAIVMTLSGQVMGRGRDGPGNPVAGVERAAVNLGKAVQAALASVDQTDVRAATVGLAGLAAADSSLWTRFPVPPRVVGDVVVAFAAGTPQPSGTVLISGTGAIAGRIVEHELVTVADGHGWQLGDQGSAFWLGRRAAQSAARDVCGTLTALVLDHLGVTAADNVPAAVQSRAPLALCELAPLVSQAAAAGDLAAHRIVAEAATRLVRTLREVHEPGLPIVLAGSVLTSPGPIRNAVLGLLAGEDVMTAGHGAGAAAWLAAKDLLPAFRAAELHPAFTVDPP